MYNCKLFLSLFTLLCIFSCSEDDDGIVGTWILSSVSLTSCPDDIPETTISANNGCVFLFEESLCLDMVFTSDGTASITFKYDDDEPEMEFGTYTDVNESLQICFDGDCQNLSLENDILILSTIEEGCVIEFSFEKE